MGQCGCEIEYLLSNLDLHGIKIISIDKNVFDLVHTVDNKNRLLRKQVYFENGCFIEKETGLKLSEDTVIRLKYQIRLKIRELEVFL